MFGLAQGVIGSMAHLKKNCDEQRRHRQRIRYLYDSYHRRERLCGTSIKIGPWQFKFVRGTNGIVTAERVQ